VAQLTYTGFVHADPHEGNLLLDERDGSLVFLDFGLVSEVEPYVMEGFARVGLEHCFQSSGWMAEDVYLYLLSHHTAPTLSNHTFDRAFQDA